MMVQFNSNVEVGLDVLRPEHCKSTQLSSVTQCTVVSLWPLSDSKEDLPPISRSHPTVQWEAWAEFPPGPPSTWPPTELHLHLIRCSSLLLDQRGITGEKKTALGRMGKWGQGLGSSGSSGCPVCLRSVFPMEAVMAADRTPYHKVNNLIIRIM